MARKKTNSPPQSANLTVEQMKSALPRLRKRLDDLRAFDPTNVTRRADPNIKALANAIDDSLVKIFGEGTTEYIRYNSATNLDTAGLYIGRSVPIHEVIQGLQYGKERAITIIEGIMDTFLEDIESTAPLEAAQVAQDIHHDSKSRNVFIVHGSDHGTRDTVARFLEKLDLVPIILDEEANKGRTIHQKFRDHSTVAYAVVLFTPDNEGRRADNSEPMRPRPRQNVVYE